MLTRPPLLVEQDGHVVFAQAWRQRQVDSLHDGADSAVCCLVFAFEMSERAGNEHTRVPRV